MKTPNRKFLLGLAALALCGPALAHDPGRYPSHPEGGWAGNVTLRGGSQGYSGWLGHVGVGNVYAYAPAYVPWVAAVPLGHRHGPSCHHAPRYAHEHGHGKAHKQHRGHGLHHGTGRHRHD